MLTREQILTANDLVTETVAVPEWGGDVLVRTMTGSERDAFEAGISALPEASRLKDIRAKLCALCIVDPNGARLFAPNETSVLGAKSAAALDRVFAAAMRLNGLSKKDVDDLTSERKAE